MRLPRTAVARRRGARRRDSWPAILRGVGLLLATSLPAGAAPEVPLFPPPASTAAAAAVLPVLPTPAAEGEPVLAPLRPLRLPGAGDHWGNRAAGGRRLGWLGLQATPPSSPSPVRPSSPGEPGPAPEQPPSPAADDADATPPTQQYQFNTEVTIIPQTLFRFRSPYAAASSFNSYTGTRTTNTYTLYTGARIGKQLQAYLDPEMARGLVLSGGVGLGGYPNGDFFGQGYVSDSPYFARYYLQWTIPTGPGREPVQPDLNVLGGTQPTHRLTFAVGRFSTVDFFDNSSYSGDQRTQFMNAAALNNLAYDYAQDIRGYTRGVMVEWAQPNWAVRWATLQMPTEPAGQYLSLNLDTNRSDQLEFEWHPKLLRWAPDAAAIRTTGFVNLGPMADFQKALALARRSGGPPSVETVREEGNVKYGALLNLEQSLADDGNTGIFSRLGWNNGDVSNCCYAVCNSAFTFGGQVSGVRWKRPNDVIGVAFAQHGISADQQAYLAAGGLTIAIGDGRLNYGPEQLVEAYYSYQVTPWAWFSLDYQFINYPGYNRDRGPLSILSVRLRLMH